MRDRAFEHRNLHEVLLGILHALGDGRGHFAGLAQTVAHDAVLVTDHDDRRKTERTATLGHLRHALDADEPVLQFQIARSYLLYVGV